MAKRNLPNGNRVIVAPTIGGKKRYCRCKSGTARALGLKPVDGIPKGAKNAVVRGAKGTKSFQLYFKKATTVGGATVKTIDFPVPSEVKLRDFYAWAKSKNALAGIRSPHGISYFWATAATSGSGGGSSGGGGIPLPGGGSLSLEDVGDVVDGIKDVIGGANPVLELIEGVVDIVSD